MNKQSDRLEKVKLIPTYSVINAIFQEAKSYGEFRFLNMARYASGKPLAAFSTRLVRGTDFP